MSTPDLFEVEKSLSPRLIWLEEHSIHTHKSPPSHDWEPWSAWSGELQAAIMSHNIGEGNTEDDAIADWARRNDVRLWNEQGYQEGK